MNREHLQHDYGLRFDWGLPGAKAVGRSRVTNGQISLSPNTIRRTAAPRRLVLPSPNGSTISFELGTGTGVCIGASLRNATAVADWIARHCTSTSVVSVIAAGEKWPGGELRPAIEDLWGAGAVLSALSATWVGRRLFAGSSGGHDRLADPPAVPRGVCVGTGVACLGIPAGRRNRRRGGPEHRSPGPRRSGLPNGFAIKWAPCSIPGTPTRLESSACRPGAWSAAGG
ncbi:2-phosphosulfolactate phosphatase [Rhodococcus opacus RKJ300 = JCM 13270]|uniref:2-phosphosulfolactate phosphatase n=1 Tax=Rhodococcus opacus RKJ300 = JCM 13270 TaxID=1165867 RepID=I0WVM7_RHOOP|nr:2-phosphosulfolactate phosphatase [Rhodococcus opacus RKJ300 = JCM 13270]